jgi:hypothetical protein
MAMKANGNVMIISAKTNGESNGAGINNENINQ